MPTNLEENLGSITRLDWSADDDDFFSEDGKENTDAGWDDNFDVDEDLDITSENEKTGGINSPKLETSHAEQEGEKTGYNSSPKPENTFAVPGGEETNDIIDPKLETPLAEPEGEKTDGIGSPKLKNTFTVQAGEETNNVIDPKLETPLVEPEGEKTDDIGSPKLENPFVEDTTMGTTSTANEYVDDTNAAFSSTNSQKELPNSVPSDDPSPPSDINMTIIDDSSSPKGPKANYTVSGIPDNNTGPASVPGTPFSQLGTMVTSLVELEDGDENFEEIVRKRNRVRKEREDHHIAHIKVQMSRLEDALAAETKRRVDATTALDNLARTQVYEMEERVRGQLEEENERLQSRLGALEERVRLLEENWTLASNNQIELVNSKAAELSKSIAQVRDDQNMERKARLKREGIILQQVEGHAKEAEERWTFERNDRVQRLKELEDQIIRNEARLALEQKRHEDRIETELAALKEELEIEVAERQTQDEEIVAALNRYTQQLQHSLSILSSD